MRTILSSVLPLASSVLMLAACTPQPQAAHYTLPQYRADAALREQQLAACANDPGTLAKTPDCINAREAKRLEETHSLRDLPPLDLSSKTERGRAGDATPAERAPPN